MKRGALCRGRGLSPAGRLLSQELAAITAPHVAFRPVKHVDCALNSRNTPAGVLPWCHVIDRVGSMPCSRHTRCTVAWLEPTTCARLRTVQRPPCDGGWRLIVMMRATRSWSRPRFRPRPGASTRSACGPPPAKRIFHRNTVRRLIPSCAAIRALDHPAPDNSTTKLRVTTRWGVVAALVHRARRARSTGPTWRPLWSDCLTDFSDVRSAACIRASTCRLEICMSGDLVRRFGVNALGRRRSRPAFK